MQTKSATKPCEGACSMDGNLRLSRFVVTRYLVSCEDIFERSTWKPPTHPLVAAEGGNAIIKAMGGDDGEEITVFSCHSALDEWLLSNDREALSPIQRVFCACLLLEFFNQIPSAPRNVLSVRVAVMNTLPAICQLTNSGLAAIRRGVSDTLSHSKLDLDEIERNELQFANAILAETYCRSVKSSRQQARQTLEALMPDLSEDERTVYRNAMAMSIADK